MGDNRVKPPPPVSGRAIHETKSRGVTYEFVQGARRWQTRQRRYLVVGGDFNGQMMTRWEISQSRLADFYQEYHSVRKEQVHTMIWAYIT